MLIFFGMHLYPNILIGLIPQEFKRFYRIKSRQLRLHGILVYLMVAPRLEEPLVTKVRNGYGTAF